MAKTANKNRIVVSSHKMLLNNIHRVKSIIILKVIYVCTLPSMRYGVHVWLFEGS